MGAVGEEYDRGEGVAENEFHDWARLVGGLERAVGLGLLIEREGDACWGLLGEIGGREVWLTARDDEE